MEYTHFLLLRSSMNITASTVSAANPNSISIFDNNENLMNRPDLTATHTTPIVSMANVYITRFTIKTAVTVTPGIPSFIMK